MTYLCKNGELSGYHSGVADMRHTQHPAMIRSRNSPRDEIDWLKFGALVQLAQFC